MLSLAAFKDTPHNCTYGYEAQVFCLGLSP